MPVPGAGMSERRKLIVVSNRGPLSFDRDAHGERIILRGGGGLLDPVRPGAPGLGETPFEGGHINRRHRAAGGGALSA